MVSPGRSSATPMLAVTGPGGPSGVAAMSSRIFSASWMAPPIDVMGATTTNSSPPQRATTSDSRTFPSTSRADEDLISGRVAVPVVHRLEVIEVEDHERQRLVVAARPGHLARDGSVEAH